MNSSVEPRDIKKVNITVAGQSLQAREGETIIHALWQAGQGHLIQTGCVGGVCGACTVTLRFKDGRPGGTDLACLRPVEEGMEVFPFPVDALASPAPVADPDGEKLRAVFPTVDRCTKCDNCTVACPMQIPVMDSVLRMQKGEFPAVAEDFTTCIHCGLCRAVCEDKVLPHTMGIWVRRSLGMSLDTASLDQTLDSGMTEAEEKEWEHLLNGDDEERLQRAKAFREKGTLA
ncbi:MAG: 4Fe-4S dicluster domain-containing protein [Nitrospinaceae bacterium]|nr:4Fe-4S dicluster domain-containing protein [Nitrospinaceae bacterium]NIR55203.1 4Fe-4S dicluster domain-containing protein [Nitrospinaceae bacterium]NIS85630.1 4Fe-4S dicluster domain-containing protein [Nitrospinaceae bacterium]NIT82475.1 4Fe-4S dicluster domain-containing protein [Nitrospinaceae bacterium]NIU44680.1 4Fe-4S dicluster domain-containing protein [Nitrospinaceae bacterium]